MIEHRIPQQTSPQYLVTYLIPKGWCVISVETMAVDATMKHNEKIINFMEGDFRDAECSAN
ncbi:Hypothetical protein Cp267_1818 [Corynebacterium pseudotuberculosis 267]|nr:Hypothetical protein Cp267_1818 [Corynebacterium pseudotuberculosis 267]